MTYYIDSLYFSGATSVYTDIGLNTVASDGYYSFSGTYRQQSGGVLITSSTPCNLITNIVSSNVWIFNISRPSPFSNAKTSSTSDTVINSGTENIGNALDGSNFEIGRLLAVFDTTGVDILPTGGTVSFYVTSNSVVDDLTFNNVKPNTTFLPSQVMTTSDWNNWNGSNDGSGISQSSRLVNSGVTGKFTLALSSSQLSDIYNNNSFSYYLISNGDIGDLTPSTNSRPLFSSESGLGISGTGDYELILNY